MLTRLMARGLPFLDQILASGGNAAVAIILARTLEPAAFGVFVLSTVVIWFVAGMQNAILLHPMSIRGAPLDDKAFRQFLGANAAIQLALASTFFVLVLVFALAWQPLRAVALPLAVTAALFLFQEFFRRALYTRANMPAAATISFITYDLHALLVGLAAWLTPLTVDNALWLLALCSLFAAIVGIVLLHGIPSLDFFHTRVVLRENLRIGKWLVPANLLSFLSVHGYPAILTAFSGLSSAAGFGVIRQIAGVLNLLTRPVDNYYLPRASAAYATERTSGLNRVLLQATLVVAPLSVVYTAAVVVSAEVLLDVVFGTRYAQYGDALQIFAVASLVEVVNYILTIEIQTRRMQRYLFAMEVWRVAITYTVGIYLISTRALTGLALLALLTFSGQCLFLMSAVLYARYRSKRRVATHGGA